MIPDKMSFLYSKIFFLLSHSAFVQHKKVSCSAREPSFPDRSTKGEKAKPDNDDKH